MSASLVATYAEVETDRRLIRIVGALSWWAH
jgi:hypothetical protein